MASSLRREIKAIRGPLRLPSTLAPEHCAENLAKWRERYSILRKQSKNVDTHLGALGRALSGGTRDPLKYGDGWRGKTEAHVRRVAVELERLNAARNVALCRIVSLENQKCKKQSEDYSSEGSPMTGTAGVCACVPAGAVSGGGSAVAAKGTGAANGRD